MLQHIQILFLVVPGPNIDIAIKLIKRMKSLFERKMGLTFPSKETVIELNGCRIEAYPSNHIDAYRALDNPKLILPQNTDAYINKGLSLYNLGKNAEAITYFDKVLTVEPNNLLASSLKHRAELNLKGVP
jgi:tetratricopeptide (TPR) repeat protein